MYKTAPIIEKWYKALDFPQSYDKEFFDALNSFEILDSVSIITYDVEKEPCMENLLSVLYMCESTAESYKKLGIPQEILIATLKDIVVWTNTYTGLKGKLCLGEVAWLKRHLCLELFRVGRLQFSKGQCVHNVPEYDYFDTDFGLEVHIPEDGKLDEGECRASIEKGKEFFARYFPEYEYKYVTCHSWLLDKTLEKYLKPGSNILRFANMFTIIHEEESCSLLGYIFRWGIKKEELTEIETNSAFGERIKNAVLSGEKFHITLGIIKR